MRRSLSGARRRGSRLSDDFFARRCISGGFRDSIPRRTSLEVEMSVREEEKVPPNVFFYVIGVAVILAGVGLIVVGVGDIVATVQRYESPLRGRGPAALASGAAKVFWGMFVLTMGRIVWRGARRRGGKDRAGRLLMILGCGLMGFAVQGLLSGVPELLHSTTEAHARASLIAAYIPYVVLGIPAAIVALIGSKMAKETKPLITVSAKANF
jgi:hypothetical protein